MDKIKFPKETEIVSAEELGIDSAPGVMFEFWKNPSKKTVKALFDVIMASAEELSSLNKEKMAVLEKEYYEALCQLIVDSNVESFDFSTPEAAMNSFDAPDVPIGFMHQVVTCYLRRLLEFNSAVVKALALYLIGSASGSDNATKKAEK